MLTEEQVEKRNRFIGGSDCAAVLGLSRWSTPLRVWAEKTGQLPKEDKSDVLAIEVGNELEDVVCRLFTKKTGKQLRRVNEAIIHPKYPFIGGYIDRRVVGEDALFEAKTASAWKAKEWQGEDIPKEYILQVMHYLAVTGQKVGYLACLIGGNQQFVWKTVERDEDLILDIIEREVYFWKTFVEPKVMPHVVRANDSETLYKLFPLDDDSEIRLSDDANKLCESLSAMVADSKLLDSEIERTRNELRLMLQDHSVGTTDAYKVTWKAQERKEHVVPASKCRVLRVAKIKQDKQGAKDGDNK